MRLIIVNDRSFFEPDGDDGSRGSVDDGGLATSLTSDDFPDKLFVSSARGPVQRALAARGTVDFDAGYRRFRVRLVASPEAAYRAFYDVAANDLLWLLHHGRWHRDVGPAEIGAYRAGYRVVNETIARAVAEEVEATGDQVHVLWQDYQFYLAPAMVRRALPPSARARVVLQHFLHVPFPEPDDWARLSAGIGADLLRGLLGNDVVGFQLPAYGRRFLRCCRRFLGLPANEDAGVVQLPDGRVVGVASYPIPAAPGHVTATARRAGTRELAAGLRRRVGNRALIYRTERVDPVKAFPDAMRAYDMLLRRPGIAGNVVYVAQLVPARQSIPRFAAERERDERIASEINERHRTEGWQPVELVFARDFPRAVAGYLEYDVLDIVPWADGMNLVALEGPLVTVRDGVLVLSTSAGAHELLRPNAIGVAARAPPLPDPARGGPRGPPRPPRAPPRRAVRSPRDAAGRTGPPRPRAARHRRRGRPSGLAHPSGGRGTQQAQVGGAQLADRRRVDQLGVPVELQVDRLPGVDTVD